jgi:ATP-dependent exoDNAse (exonuclease V) beta subunit
MNRRPSDQAARERFTNEWSVNFAVVASAGSGKTTAISERLASLALSEQGADALAHTAVVTYTTKAAAQIGQRARSVLLRRMAADGLAGAEPLARLERVFFNTIHSFCILLARRHGSTFGVHLNPVVVARGDEAHFDEFLEQDPMTFDRSSKALVSGFLRHEPLDVIFDLAAEMDHATANRLLDSPASEHPPQPSAGALARLMDAAARKGKGADALGRNKAAAQEWVRRFSTGSGRLPIPKPEGKAGGIEALFGDLFAPLKEWLAQAGGALAAELSLRYRAWRLERGIQTYADQIETALAVLKDEAMLEKIRAEGWRVVLDEAQDTDPKQFEVLVEIARPPGAPRGTWPIGAGPGPRPGHFCMVGDSQQGIYSDRADIRNFQDHVRAFERGNGGELLKFDVTFRIPRRVITLLNATLPPAFGGGRLHNVGVPASPGAPGKCLQVAYEALVPGPANVEGGAWRIAIAAPATGTGRGADDRRLASEVLQVARLIGSGGPAAVGAAALGDICILAPRNSWLHIVRDEFERAGVKTALQMRRNRNGDNPVYAWLCGLLAVACDPSNSFEWAGVLREVFAVSDASIAEALRGGEIRWDEPESYPAPISAAVQVMQGFISRVDPEGESLERFGADLASECGLAGKARMLDPEGGLGDELARLLARAAEIGAQGGGPRAWLGDLLASVGEFRAWGRPTSDAVNIMTSHSAKGLEWPVVIPVGLWRAIGTPPRYGLRLVREGEAEARVVLDNAGLSADTLDSLERARLRDLVRVLYVTMTRAKSALVIPWSEGKTDEDSFAWLWGVDPGTIGPIPSFPAADAVSPRREARGGNIASEEKPTGQPAPPFPRRILPHQLGSEPDVVRAVLHEASIDGPLPVKDAVDPLEYGTWWHQTLEFMPWSADAGAVEAHGAASLARAAAMGFGERGGEEWDRFMGSQPWRLIRESRWSRLAEAGIFAPLAPDGWIDGVIDLVLHDPEAAEVWVVDWKTNRRREGEGDEALLGRLAAAYEGQLTAYGSSIGGSFPGSRVRLWVYSTAAGLWVEVAPA